jgi:protein-L-isoaspartate(D-aspartate) O-methyltransferase
MSSFFYIPPYRKRLLSLTILLLVVIGSVMYFTPDSQESPREILGNPPVLQDTSQWRDKAKKMVRLQIEERGVTDKKVLEAMRSTPRHLFVPEQTRQYAYRDRPLAIGHGQTISQPYIVALMTEKLELEGDERVLEIGTGSGYQAAVLAQIVDSVYTIEIVKALAQTARQRLQDLSYDNVKMKHGNGYKGWSRYAPFDAIIVTAAPPEVPEALKKQLRKGGRMVVPVGKNYQNLIVLKKYGPDKFDRTQITPVRFVPMVKPE